MNTTAALAARRKGCCCEKEPQADMATEGNVTEGSPAGFMAAAGRGGTVVGGGRDMNPRPPDNNAPFSV